MVSKAVSESRRWTIPLYALAVAISLALPFFASELLAYATSLLLFMTLAVAWNIQGGYLGDLSFGHVSFFGIAAYTCALLEHYKLLHFAPLNILLGALLASAFAAVIGIPFLRLRGFYFAIGTLGLSNLLYLVYKIILWPITRGASGLIIPPPQPYHIETYYYAILLIAMGSVVLSYLVVRSKLGLAFTAIRDDPNAARAIGINTTFYRILGFAISAFVTGVGGGFFAYHNNYINPAGAFSPDTSFEMLVMVFLGGVGTLMGPVVGALILYPIEEIGRTFILRGYYILPAILLVVVFIFMPKGIVGMLKEQALFSRLNRTKRVG
jgi:branched-chain amino acid transport system permease protein